MENNQGTSHTLVNPGIAQASGTLVNPEAMGGSGTKVNPEVAGVSGTVVNNDLNMNQLQLPEGYVLQDKYTIRKRLDANSGEADLYLCEYEGKEYIAKFYRRINAIKEEVLNRLQNANFPNLPKLYAVGTLQQRQYEVMDYYKNGSMEGKRISFDELKNRFIPDMNEALHALDSMNIVHKDIKPSNIMRNDDGSYVLMDFGISSVRTNKQSLVVTKTGFTPEYISPEAIAANLYSVYSDYYALGITIYELYVGHLPYEGMNQEEISQFSLVQALPIPEDVPAQLKLLIRGLTFKDLTGRNEVGNQNIRWTYEQVKDWLAGKQMVEPTTTLKVKESEFEPYDFNNEVYTDLDALVLALVNDWEEGKKQLFRGFLQEYFRTNKKRSLASLCADLEAIGNDGAFATFVYKASNQIDKIYWKNESWYPEEFGGLILKTLWSCMDVYDKANVSKFQLILDILNNNLVSLFFESKSKGKNKEEKDEGMASTIANLSKSILHWQTSGESYFYTYLYQLGYLLTEKPVLYIKGMYFKTYEEFMKEIERRLMENEEEYKDFMDKVMVDKISKKLELQVNCWIKELGYKI